MNTPNEVRQFLQWYQEDGERPITDDVLPEWVSEKMPQSIDEQRLIALDEYDLKGRLYDEPPTNENEWVSAEQRLDAVERTWTESTNQEGLEAFAWYIPFHFSTRRWGIYVNEIGIQLLGHLFYQWSKELSGPDSVRGGSRSGWSPGDSLTAPVTGGGDPGDPAFEMITDAFNLALEILLRHEWYHHQTELLAAHLEDAAESMYYERYHKLVYQNTFATESCVEESLANAYVYRSRGAARKAPSRDVFRALFHKSTERQPTAYQNYSQFRGNDYRRGGQFLGHLIRTGDPKSSPMGVEDPKQRVSLGANVPFSTALYRPRYHRSIPIYIVKPTYDLPTISYFKAVQLETNYDIVRSDQWEEKYGNVSNHLRSLADKTVEKIDVNANLPGFNWRSCPQGYEYGRMNKQYRLIINRREKSNTIELIDFGEHDMPKIDYNCY